MNDKDKEAFEKWFKETETLQCRGVKTDFLKIWHAACEYKQNEIDRMINYTIPGYQTGIEELQNIIEKLQKENDDFIVKLKCLKNDYWFMIILIEKYSSDKEQALADCLERMKFRKPLFNFLEEE